MSSVLPSTDGVARCEQLLSSDQYLPWEIMHAVTIIYEVRMSLCRYV